MKKLVVLLLALSVAGFAFAQTTIGGNFRGGLTMSGANNTASPYFSHFDTTFASVDKDGNYGVNSDLRWDNLKTDYTSTLGTPTMLNGYAWAKMANGMVKVTGGVFDNYDYDLGTNAGNRQLSNIANDEWALGSEGATGILVQLFPIKGLNIGVAGLANTITNGNWGWLSKFSAPNGTFSGANLYAGVNYAIDGFGAVVLEGQGNDDMTNGRYSASVNFTGMSGLNATVGYQHNGMNNWTSGVWGKDGGFAVIDYTMGDLFFEVAPQYVMADTTGTVQGATNFYVEGTVQYIVVPGAVVRVYGAYDQNGAYIGDGTSNGNTMMFGAELGYSIAKGVEVTFSPNYYNKTGYTNNIFVKVGL